MIVRTRPTPQHYRRRRVAALIIIALVSTAAVFAGVSVQKLTGWSAAKQWKPLAAVTISPSTSSPVQSTPQKQSSSSAASPPQQPQNQQEDLGSQPAAVAHSIPKARSSHGFSKPNGVPQPGHTGMMSIMSSGRQRTALVEVPPQASAGNPTPLILAFHGYEETPEKMSRVGLGAGGAIVVYPAGIGRAWEGAPYASTTRGEDVQFTRDLMDAMSASYTIDASRVYVAGMSNGGGFALKLACEMPEEFAAVASVAGAYYPGTWQGCAPRGTHPQPESAVRFAPGASTAFLEIHGRKDDTIMYSGGVRHNAPYLGAIRLSSLYAGRAGCFGAPLITGITPQITQLSWPDCRDGEEVMHIQVKGAAHVWPGSANGGNRNNRSFSATQQVLAFFARHTKGTKA